MPAEPCNRQQAVAALRILALDAVEKANSGHPGMVLGMADIAERLFTRHLRHNPADPDWPDRDRFVLSNGHGSMLLYGLLHLSGYDLSADDLAAFRQTGSRTPGHPEKGMTPGVETTTGPLGQGLATAVGMAMAEKTLAARFNRPDMELVNHRTWVFAGDGCLMEGVSQEAVSLAGVQKLGKLVVFWDDNGISIDGPVSGWFAEDVRQRFAAAGWHCTESVDGHDPAAVDAAIERAMADPSAPWLIPCRTRIGFEIDGLEGQAAAHSGAIGPQRLEKARELWDWPHPPFVVPQPVRDYWDGRDRGGQLQAAWRESLAQYCRQYPSEGEEFKRRLAGELPDMSAAFAELFAEAEGNSVASRKALQQALEKTAPLLPELIGTSADLAGSNGVIWSGVRPISAETADGNYFHAGVREFGMSAAMNGLMLHGGFRPYGGTFLVFSDYARPALRLAALMEQPVIFVYSHDSIAVGEDGPTHQPVEHLAALRAIPGLEVWRPADALETAVAWQQILSTTDRPSALILSRQTLPALPACPPQHIAAGARAVGLESGSSDAPDLLLLASGSEVHLCTEAAQQLAADGIRTRVISVPCMSRLQSDAALQTAMLPPGAKRLAVEASTGGDWWRWLGANDALMAMDSFGLSGPGEEVVRHFGFEAGEIARRARILLES